MKWADYHKQAKERGALALELFVAQSVPAKGPEDVKASLAAHLACLLYTSPSPRDKRQSRMPSSA